MSRTSGSRRQRRGRSSPWRFGRTPERALESATSQLGEALKLLLAEDVNTDKAAALLELEATEVRRLVRAASTDAGESNARRQSGATVSVLPGAVGDRVASQAG